MVSQGKKTAANQSRLGKQVETACEHQRLRAAQQGVSLALLCAQQRWPMLHGANS